jgi:hypothetical protein
VLLAGGLAFARWVRPRIAPGRAVLLASALAAVVLLALGPIAIRRSETAAFTGTPCWRWPRPRPRAGLRPAAARPELTSPACREPRRGAAGLRRRASWRGSRAAGRSSG